MKLTRKIMAAATEYSAKLEQDGIPTGAAREMTAQKFPAVAAVMVALSGPTNEEVLTVKIPMTDIERLAGRGFFSD